MTDRKGVYEGKNQLWDTFPARYTHWGELWDTAKKRWFRMAKGAIIAVAGLGLALLTLIYLPFNIFTAILAGVFMAFAAIGYGQLTITYMLYSKVDANGAALIWTKWSDMGGVEHDEIGKRSGVWFNK